MVIVYTGDFNDDDGELVWIDTPHLRATSINVDSYSFFLL